MNPGIGSSARMAGGQFRPGVSGNPAGRPRGSKNRSTLFLDLVRDGERERIGRAVIELALAGEKRFLHFVAAQIFPRPRGCAFDLELPEELEADARAILDEALRMMSRGEISALEGLDMARVVEKRERAARAAPPVSSLYPSGDAKRSGQARRQGRQADHEPVPNASLGALGPLGGAIKPTASAAPAAPCKSPVFAGEKKSPTRVDLLASASRAALAA
jgi:hypothetical protein